MLVSWASNKIGNRIKKFTLLLIRSHFNPIPIKNFEDIRIKILSIDKTFLVLYTSEREELEGSAQATAVLGIDPGDNFMQTEFPEGVIEQ